jgi:hypothetical protein
MQFCLPGYNSWIDSHGSVSNSWLRVQNITAGNNTSIWKQQNKWHKKAENITWIKIPILPYKSWFY